MCQSHTHHLFFVLILGQFTAFLPCHAALSDQEQDVHVQSLRQEMTQCLKNCSTSVDKISSSRKTCYKECLKRKDSLGSYGNQQVKPFSKRIKRDVGPANETGRSNCTIDNADHVEWDDNSRVYATFHKLKGTERCYANVTWDRLQNTSVNLKGYYLQYRIYQHPQSILRKAALGKDDSYYIVNNSSYGINHDSHFYVSVTTLPYVNCTKLYYRFFKVECSEMVSTTDHSTPSPTSDHSSLSPTSDYSTPSPTSGREIVTLSSLITGHSTPSPTSDNKANGSEVTIAVTTSIASVVVAIVALILIWYFRRSKTSKFAGEEKFIARYCYEPLLFEYDAFIIYSSKDEEWVKGTLLTTLEEKHGLKCCIHYRNFTPGVFYRENMVDSVYKSRKTVAVLSTNFFSSGFCESEFEYARRRLTERRDDSLIVIRLDEFNTDKLPMELKQRSYIDCPKSVEKETWESKLVNSLKVSC